MLGTNLRTGGLGRATRRWTEQNGRLVVRCRSNSVLESTGSNRLRRRNGTTYSHANLGKNIMTRNCQISTTFHQEMWEYLSRIRHEHRQRSGKWRASALETQGQLRYFSKSSGEDKDKTSDGEGASETDRSRDDASTTKKLTLEQMDPEFQEYLMGEENNKLMPEQMGTVRVPRRLLDSERDKDLFARVRKQQLLQKEQARLKTATNVNRALMGNVVICGAKLVAWVSSGSSAMLAEFIHSVVDCGNQALLLIGLRDSRLSADGKHPYGYGKSVYFWALVSALGTFFLGAGVSMTHAIGDLLDPSLQEITWHVWGVLGLSLTVDGYVLAQTLYDVKQAKPADIPFWKYLQQTRDPATLAVLLEDGAACLGVVMATCGIVLTHATGNPVFDGLAGVGISSLLGFVGIVLVRVNHRFLLGQAVDKEITDDIGKILLSRRSVDSIRSIQSQWTGPETFSYKAEVDFDGTYLAAKLMPYYKHEFEKIRDTVEDELQVLLAFYAEDVMRSAEREVRHVEALIRKKYPGAEYIELEPMSVDADRLAIDDNQRDESRKIEGENLSRYLHSLKAEQVLPNDSKNG